MDDLRFSWRRFKSSSSDLWRLHFRDEDGGNMDFWNVGILPQSYMAPQPRTTRLVIFLVSIVFSSPGTLLSTADIVITLTYFAIKEYIYR